ncbi:hypothetical protein BC643_2024 [Mangrovibacterium diazotrophicum]|uniref:Uncharacterized protein n=2 Tax=Mangrovibacterium diazotrophicum TaxID=1261403 RepID=A0A419W8H0_9BACT|nr:hypothetical protein BC643_2024 [Mangrovibacterium diazotrophicum]
MISIGMLIVVLPNLYQKFSGHQLSDFWSLSIMFTGITLEITGLIKMMQVRKRISGH